MDMENHPRIWMDRKRCGEKPCIRGHRVRVIDVLAKLAAGESRTEIQKRYSIEDEDITAAIEFAQDLIESWTGQLSRDADPNLEKLVEDKSDGIRVEGWDDLPPVGREWGGPDFEGQ